MKESENRGKYRSSFKSSRYTYEPSANKSHRDDIIKLTAKLLCYVVLLYKQQGCKDSFIQSNITKGNQKIGIINSQF